MTISELIVELQKLDQTRLVMIDQGDALYKIESVRECTIWLANPEFSNAKAEEIDGHEDEYDEDSTYLAVVIS